ncbi:MAG: hypothetical protein MK102_04920 [Fuerstiella sp.]|nr:hypothetical protein [Fuerstiella sp.]
MRDPRISFRSRSLAAVLAFLLPGVGHLYQGRRLKGGIFAICILCTFFAGLVLGEGQPVYCGVIHTAVGGTVSAQMNTGRYHTERSLGYYVQVFVGIPALPALIQSWRYGAIENTPHPPMASMIVDFEGNVLGADPEHRQRNLAVKGKLSLRPGQGHGMTGTVSGTTKGGEQVSFELDGRAILGRPVFGSPRQEVHCELAPDESGFPRQLIGTVKRSFLDWYQAPRDNEELDRMHSRLNQKFDIACVFTWVAGLLNIMAIWDAYDGPAYGYGDEDDSKDD